MEEYQIDIKEMVAQTAANSLLEAGNEAAFFSL